MSLSSAVDDYFAWLAPRKLSAASIKAYQQDIELIGRELASVCGVNQDDLKLDQLDRLSMRAAFGAYSADHSKASILRAHSTWRQFFEFLVADGLVEGNPMAAVSRPKADEQKPKPLEGWAEDTVTLLLKSATTNERGPNAWQELDVAVIATLLSTGARSSELLAMNIGSIEGQLGEQVIRVIGKGSKPRTIPVEEALDFVLGRYLASRIARFPVWKPKPSDPLFVAIPRRKALDLREGGRRMNASQLHYLLEQTLAAAGLSNRRVEGAMAHAFRHTYGTTLAADGAPVSAIRKLMGHSSINTSQGYIDSLAREEREVAAKNRVYDILGDLNADADD